MGSVKKKLEDFMNQSFDDTKGNNLRQSKSLKYLEGGKTHTIDDIKSKINQFKKLKHESQTEDVLNFDISREALKKYQPPTHTSDNNLGMMALNKSKSKPLVTQHQQVQQPKQNQRQTMTEGSTSSNSIFNINVKNIFKSAHTNSNNNKERPQPLIEQNNPIVPPKVSHEGTGIKQYIQWQQRPKKSSGSLNYNTTNNNEFITGKTPNSNDDQNRIKTQINMFVKQLNYTTAPMPSHTNPNTNINLTTNTNLNTSTYSKGNGSKRTSAPVLTSIKHHIPSNSNNILNPIIFNNNQSNNNNSNTNSNQNLIINGLDSFQLTDSVRGKNYANMMMDNQSSSSVLKYDEIKTIKSSLYAMTNEEIAQLPQEYIDELKDLACLINTVF